MDDDERIRRKAHELWEHEGRPEGRAEAHWASAREIVALEDSYESTLTPVEDTLSETVEPEFMAENQGDMPGLTDLGEDAAGPSRELERSLADERPLSTKEPKPKEKKPARKAKAKA